MPSWRQRNVEHCCGHANILCGFHVTESDLLCVDKSGRKKKRINYARLWRIRKFSSFTSSAVLCLSLDINPAVFSAACVLTHLSIPFKSFLYFWDMRAPPPHAASTCSQRLYFSHKSAISSNGSNAPNTVVPVKHIKKECTSYIIEPLSPSSSCCTYPRLLRPWTAEHLQRELAKFHSLRIGVILRYIDVL